jgi:hypothetical protein
MVISPACSGGTSIAAVKMVHVPKTNARKFIIAWSPSGDGFMKMSADDTVGHAEAHTR